MFPQKEHLFTWPLNYQNRKREIQKLMFFLWGYYYIDYLLRVSILSLIKEENIDQLESILDN